MKKKILFICTHNSARSQIAEGLTNHFFGDRWEAFSAGTEATFVKPPAIKVLKELGIDISHHRSKLITEFRGEQFDLVVTVCDSAKENCPYFPGAKKYIHYSFKDPSDTKGSEEDVLRSFRDSREKIKKWLDEFLRK
ncbi:MAG: arsenate reductase ArsC [Acidobacteriota bacterium]